MVRVETAEEKRLSADIANYTPEPKDTAAAIIAAARALVKDWCGVCDGYPSCSHPYNSFHCRYVKALREALDKEAGK
ncbi:MAG: hypothetical protein WC481_07725 [Candidatus Omnitrophota bacterium]